MIMAHFGEHHNPGASRYRGSFRTSDGGEMRYYNRSTKPLDPTGEERMNIRLANLTRRLSGGLWTVRGNTLARTSQPTPTQVNRINAIEDHPEDFSQAEPVAATRRDPIHRVVDPTAHQVVAELYDLEAIRSEVYSNLSPEEQRIMEASAV
jgi:hypothetical protein